MSDRDECARAARAEAYAMCKGCPLTPKQVSDFVASWIVSELAWFDRKQAGFT